MYSHVKLAMPSCINVHVRITAYAELRVDKTTNVEQTKYHVTKHFFDKMAPEGRSAVSINEWMLGRDCMRRYTHLSFCQLKALKRITLYVDVFSLEILSKICLISCAYLEKKCHTQKVDCFRSSAH